ncbi:MAG: M14 family metallopeptidase [Candidatus Aminicenantes bacterium]
MTKVRSIYILLITIILFTGIVGAESSLPPEKVFGFPMGADRKLIDWNRISDYFLALDKGSDRIMVKELGKTTLGKPFLLAIISSAENIKNLERYQDIQQQLANPYELPEEKALSLVEEGKVVVLVTLNIHSTEIASSQESVELAYEMATHTDPGIKKILDNVILLLIPSLNPDGQQMVVDWYKKHVGTPYEGCNMPWLYHHYAGHDNNRDWYMFNLKESQLTAPVLYQQWFPEIVYDQHQMGSTGPRLFMPPYSDPVNRNTHTLVMAETNMLGKHVVADLHEQGFKGIITGMRFNAFFEGTMSKTPLWHNMVGILSEMASARIATPVYLPRGSLGRYGAEIPKYSRVTDFLDPWEGGWWRLRDIIAYEKAVTYSILDLAATYKKKFMMNFYAMNKESIERGKKEPPYAFIIPLTQHDPNSAAEMLKRLKINGARIYRAQSQFVYDGQTYPAGTYVIPLSQPSRPCIKDLLEPQNYPDLERYPGGPPQPPYDVTGWTINIQMGVDVIEMKSPLQMGLSITDTFDFGPSGMMDAPAKAYLVERRYNNSFAVLNELLKDNAEVYWADMEFPVDGKTYPAGTFIIPAQKGIDKKLESLANEFKVPVYSINQPVPIKGTKALLPRLGLYHPWTASMDEGWTRLVLDNYRYSYRQLYNEEIKKGKLAEKFDVIILPDLSIPSIVEGKRRRWGYSEPSLGDAQQPEKYRGGIGKEGVKALTDFVKAGGTLIAFGQASDFAIEKIRVPAVNVLKGLDGKEFYAPGSLLQIELDTTQPLAYGMPEKTAIRMTNSPAFSLRLHIQESRAIGYYGEDNPLLSGWLKGPEKLAGKTALAEILIEKGRVILFGFRVQSRAQTFGTFKLLFNAIHTSRIKPVKSII